MGKVVQLIEKVKSNFLLLVMVSCGGILYCVGYYLLICPVSPGVCHGLLKSYTAVRAVFNRVSLKPVQCTKIITVEPRLSGLFLWSQFCHEYLLVIIKIPSILLFKTTALKSKVNASLFLFHGKKQNKAALAHVVTNAELSNEF